MEYLLSGLFGILLSVLFSDVSRNEGCNSERISGSQLNVFEVSQTECSKQGVFLLRPQAVTYHFYQGQNTITASTKGQI